MSKKPQLSAHFSSSVKAATSEGVQHRQWEQKKTDIESNHVISLEDGVAQNPVVGLGLEPGGDHAGDRIRKVRPDPATQLLAKQGEPGIVLAWVT